MPRLSLSLLDRSLPIQCEDGEEARVEALAGYVDGRLRQLSAAQSGASESRLLMLGCLMLADEIFELKSQKDGRTTALGPAAKQAFETSDPELETVLVAAVTELRGKLDRLARKLEG